MVTAKLQIMNDGNIAVVCCASDNFSNMIVLSYARIASCYIVLQTNNYAALVKVCIH